MRLVRRALYGVMFAACFASGAAAQSVPVDQTPTFKVSTRTVSLDVVVRDKSGNLVTDLTKDDFQVLEDQVPQAIASFESPTERAATAASDAGAGPAELTAAARQNRARTLLLLDEFNTRFADVAYAKQQIKKFLRSSGTVLPQPTALYALSMGRLWLIQNYTSDSNALIKALDRHPPILPRAETSEGFQEELDRFGVCMGVMREIARAQGGVPGRKNLVWVTAGFPEVSGSDLHQDSFVNAMRRITNVLMDAHVTLYTIDPRGLQVTQAANLTSSPFDPLGSAAAFQEAFFNNAFEHDFTLETLAQQTGGTATFARNEIGQVIAHDAQAGSEYYALTYDPSNHNWNGDYRHITVKLRRADFFVSTRLGYFALDKAAVPTQKELDLTLKRGMLSPMDYTELPTKTAWKTKLSGGHGALDVKVDRHALTLSAAQGGSSYSVQVAIAALSEKGRVLGNTVRTISGTLAESALNNINTVDFRVPVVDLPRDATSLRIAVVDTESGRLGTNNIALR